MAYIKSTNIRGTTSHPKPVLNDTGRNEDYEVWSKEMDKHSKFSSRNGHWKPASALAAAQIMGVISDVTVEHHVSDTNGKGRGGIDRRFTVSQAGVVTEIPLSTIEHEDAANQDKDNVDEAWAEVEAKADAAFDEMISIPGP